MKSPPAFSAMLTHDIRGRSEHRVSVRDYGAGLGNDDLDPVNAAIADANEIGTEVDLYFPAAHYNWEGLTDELLCSRCRITGEGDGSRIELGGNFGTFFQLGGRWSVIDRLSMFCSGDPTGDHAFVVNAPDCKILDNRVMEVAGVLKQGGSGGASRIYVENNHGTITENGTDLDWWDIAQPAGSRFMDNHFSGGLIGDDGAYWRLRGSVANSPDGLWFVGNTTFSNPGPGGTLGKQYAVHLDGVNGAMNNLRFLANGMDGSHECAIYIRLDSDIDNCRNWLFAYNRMETAGGRAIDMADAATTKSSEVFNFSNGTYFVGNDDNDLVPFLFDAPLLRGIRINNNGIKKNGDGEADALMQWNTDAMEVCHNGIILTAGSGAPDHLWKTTADVDSFTVGPNTKNFEPNVKDFSHHAYSAVTKRKVHDNGYDFKNRHGGPMFIASTSAAVAANRHMWHQVPVDRLQRIVGITYRVGGVAAGNVKVGVWSKDGALLGSSGSVAVPAGTNQANRVALTTPIIADPGDIFLSIIRSDATCELISARSFVPCNDAVESTFNLPSSITPPTAPNDVAHPMLAYYG